MPTPSERPVQAAYAGRHLLGFITKTGKSFAAETPEGKSIGSFASHRDATAALQQFAENAPHG